MLAEILLLIIGASVLTSGYLHGGSYTRLWGPSFKNSKSASRGGSTPMPLQPPAGPMPGACATASSEETPTEAEPSHVQHVQARLRDGKQRTIFQMFVLTRVRR